MPVPNDIPYGYDHWTFFLMKAGPALVVLPIGLWICFRNRFRRPLIAQLIGGAIIVELLIYCVQISGPHLLSWVLQQSRQSTVISNSEEMLKWSRFASTVSQIVSNFLFAGIWGTAIGAALYVENPNRNKPA